MEPQGGGGGEEEEIITDEQRKRAEANRIAALAKRKAIVSDNPVGGGFQTSWKLFKCRKLSSNDSFPTKPIYPIVKCGSALPKKPENFRVRLEICSLDSFSVTPMPAPGVMYPGNEACLEKISDWLSGIIPSHYTQSSSGVKSCVFKLSEYDMVLRCLKNCEGIKYEEIPWGTFNVVEKMSHSCAAGKWIPCRPEYLSDEKVDELIQNLPKVLLDALLPFQLEGVRFGLRRGGRCLIADEMGLGKTLQAIAIAGCFINEGPILIVCPAILRYPWADELERWLPFCLPSDIHLVFNHQDNPAHLTKCPKIVVISYKMLEHLERSMLEREWATLIIDESHHLRCSKKRSEPKEIKAVRNVAMKVKHLVLLSGTPSLSRPFDIFYQIDVLWPGLLGKTKYEFASTYCSVNFRQGSQGKQFQDFSQGIRLQELHILLKQTVMIRRLKQHVMSELPPIRRKIIRLDINKSDIAAAKAALEMVAGNISANDDSEDCESTEKLEDQVLGLAKLPGFLEWLSIHPIILEFNSDESAEASLSSHKMIIFAHHHKVLDRVEKFIREKGIECIRIDGNNPSPIDRQDAVRRFQSSSEVKIALVGILAGGSGLTLTAAEDVVFLELPKENANFDQAESRAHRFGQTKAVNVYIFCGKDTKDESRWQIFNDRTFQVSSAINGKYEAIHEIKVDTVSCLQTTGRADERNDNMVSKREANTEVSTESFIISQSPEQWPFKENHGSLEMVDKSNDSPKETDVISSQVESLHVEQAMPSSPCGGSSSKVTLLTSERMSSHNLEENEGNGQKKVNMVDDIDANASGIVDPNEVANRSSTQVTSLRFEVSKYTERVHLYSCIPGVDSRPHPLFQSFRPEDLESENHLSANKVKIVDKCNEDYRSAVLIFLEQWKKLRPIERKKLKAKPLQLPLSIELCYLEETLNHNKGGLLKGGSKRRKTPLNEISHPLPSNATWKKVNLFRAYGNKEKIYTQGWSSVDEPLCKLCQKPCKNDNAKKPEFFEDLFCNLECYEEYRLRTSNRSLREELFQIERGICTNCQLDCHKLVEHLKPLSFEKRQEYIKRVAPKLAKRKKLFDKLVQEPVEGNAWHADHLIPVYQGGGECRLENMRTLCVTCHADVTAAQCAERRTARQKAKKQLREIMKNLKDAEESMKINGKTKDHQQFETRENIEEDDLLLVVVPGSAYSRAKAITEQETSTS